MSTTPIVDPVHSPSGDVTPLWGENRGCSGAPSCARICLNHLDQGPRRTEATSRHEPAFRDSGERQWQKEAVQICKP